MSNRKYYTKAILSLLAVFALIFSFAYTTSAQDRVFDRYKQLDAETNYGRGYSESSDAATLSWGESYILDSYIDIYNKYKDKYWLDKFVDHFDRVKANAEDPEGDGTWGWYSPKYSYQHMENQDFESDAQDANEADAIANGGFETSGADSVPASWTREAGTNTTVYRSTAAGEYYSGSAGLAVKYNGGSAATLKQSFTYSPGRKYNLSFAAKTDSRSMVGKIQIYNETTSAVLAETATFDLDSMIFIEEWVKRSLIFTAPTTSGQTLSIKIKLAQIDQSGWAAYFDDISIKPVENIVNEVKNGSFETADSGDSTLPDKWARFGTSTYTYRSSTAGEYYSGSNGLVIKSDGSSWKELSQQLPYIPSEKYTLSIMGKTNSSSAYGRILVYNVTDSEYILDQTFNNTSWQKQSFIFTAPSLAGKTLNIYLRQAEHTHPTWIAYFDDLKIEPYTENVNGNFGFETSDGADSTLPAGWARFQSTSSNAYLSTTLNEYYSSSKGVVIKSNNSAVPMLRKQLYLIPGMQYNVKFIGRNNLPAAQGQVELYNATTATTLGSITFSNTHWEKQSFDFTATDSLTDTIYLRLRQASTATDNSLITYIDDVEVVPIVNKSFAAWERVNKTKSNAYTTNANDKSYYSSYGLVIGNDGSTDGYVKQQLLAYEANKPHSVYFNGKTSTASNGGKVVVYDVTSSTQLASMTFVNTNWADLQLDFTTPNAANHVIEIRLTQQYYNNSSQFAYFDNVSVGERVGFLIGDTMTIKGALKFIKTVHDDPDLDAIYGATADAYLDFIVEDEVLPKWSTNFVDLGNNRGTYVFPSGNRGAYFAGRTLPHNQNLVAAECYLYLWDITGIASYKTRAEQLLNFFKDNLETNSTGYKWDYWNRSGSWDNGFDYDTFEDTSHGSLDISAAITAYHYGVVFTKTDMEKFASTFVDTMWNGSMSQPVIGYNVVTNYSTTVNLIASTPYIWEFVELAEFDPQIWDISMAIVNNINGYVMPPLLAALTVYNPETTVNGNFELSNKDDSTLPTFWTRYIAYTNSSTAYRDTSNAYKGDAGLALKTNGTAWNILQQKITGYLPNSLYDVKFFAKAGSGSVQARADIYNYTAESLVNTVNVANTSWTAGTLSFTSPSNASNDIRLDLYHNIYTPANQYVYFDDVKIYPSLWNSFSPNAGFEEAEIFDSTLPKYWVRSSGTVSGKVVLTTAEKYKGSASIKLSTDVSGVSQQLVYTLKGLKPSASYTLTFYSKTNGSLAKARARVRNETTSTNLATSGLVDSTSWANYTVSFTAPSTYTDQVNIYLEHNDPTVNSGDAYFDEVGVLLN
ncbi:carbohydrate binding domain-containing protein [Paenibacillus eucommiae]|uniref:CBM-cenC domain-containing protein n=1 Tax=Paenibacillus eucommiae TaxID=1355755 RepID=A0ABS4J549_9BACL|nr:carbohydrate binding domain-containing protein [Paenibacillus eucommiae]MBP1994918.1 hypothetical protein [Paenibacillus eucommiae]